MADRLTRTRKSARTVPLLLAAFLGTVGNAVGQEPFLSDPQLEDASLSPSDRVAMLQDPAPVVQAQPNTAAQTPSVTRPNVATLGSGRNSFSALGQSTYYASPIALSLGIGGRAASSSTGRYFGSSIHRNLLDTPEMFGDFRRPGSSIVFDPADTIRGGNTHEDEDTAGGIDFPSAPAFSGMRVSENNVALPQDRVWTSFHHYHNAFALPGGDVDLNRFIFGFEKTFQDESASIEFRLPIIGSLDPVDGFGTTAFAGGSFGNLGVIFKKVVAATDKGVLAVGVRLETPTGSQWHATDTLNGNVAITLDPSAVYITPYVGALREINDIWYMNSFFQVDIATSGDRLSASLNGNPAQDFFINQPALFQADIGGGVWLITPEEGCFGLATSTEIHVATSLGDADTFEVNPTGGLPNVFVDFTPIETIVNITNGLHAQVNENLSFRTAISVPIIEDRIFDTEVMFQINQGF